jgi:Protein of unknown function (DUF2829).
MNFSEALEKVKSGYTVSRKAWICPAKVKLIATPIENNSIEGEAEFHVSIVKLSVTFNIIEASYTPTESDLLADDWYVAMTSDEKEILQFNKVIESAIYHGGDSEGPYYSNFDDMYKSITEFIKITKRNSYYVAVKNDGKIPKVMQILFKKSVDASKMIDEEIDRLIEEDNK